MPLQDVDLLTRVAERGQSHVFDGWFSPGALEEDKRRLLEQLRRLNLQYPGGITAYIDNSKKLLEESRKGTNPFEGCTPEVPDGTLLDFGGDLYWEMEAEGVVEAGDCAFVLVAGGLGERLGYSDIKLSLPVNLNSVGFGDSSMGPCFLELYVTSILELQRRAQVREGGVELDDGLDMKNMDDVVRRMARKPLLEDFRDRHWAKPKGKSGRRLPLAIMTSDDTHDSTVELLELMGNFGMDEDQIILMKQEKVACLADGNAALAMEDPFTVQTKPHGHGDVHMLLHTTGLADKWRREGFKWVCFFQDTNAQVFHGLLPALGVSAMNDYDMNSLAVPRKAKEAIGAITRLRRPDGSSITINVEYNQLDPLLRATGYPDGDVNDPTTGHSPFPGNINQLVMKLDSYCEELNRHGGVISEFVNPKYADETRTAFKKSTRLECMMQDFPKSLPSGSKVAFTTITPAYAAYSPVKNSVSEAQAKAASGNPQHSAASAEFDVYRTNCEMLQQIGCLIDVTEEPRTFNGMSYVVWPRVTWSPRFALTFEDLEEKFTAPDEVHIGCETSLYIGRDVEVDSLELHRGRLVVVGDDDYRNQGWNDFEDVVQFTTIDNDGWEWEAIPDGEEHEEEFMIRGFFTNQIAEDLM